MADGPSLPGDQIQQERAISLRSQDPGELPDLPEFDDQQKKPEPGTSEDIAVDLNPPGQGPTPNFDGLMPRQPHNPGHDAVENVIKPVFQGPTPDFDGLMPRQSRNPGHDTVENVIKPVFQGPTPDFEGLMPRQQRNPDHDAVQNVIKPVFQGKAADLPDFQRIMSSQPNSGFTQEQPKWESGQDAQDGSSPEDCVSLGSITKSEKTKEINPSKYFQSGSPKNSSKAYRETSSNFGTQAKRPSSKVRPCELPVNEGASSRVEQGYIDIHLHSKKYGTKGVRLPIITVADLQKALEVIQAVEHFKDTKPSSRGTQSLPFPASHSARPISFTPTLQQEREPKASNNTLRNTPPLNAPSTHAEGPADGREYMDQSRTAASSLALVPSHQVNMTSTTGHQRRARYSSLRPEPSQQQPVVRAPDRGHTAQTPGTPTDRKRRKTECDEMETATDEASALKRKKMRLQEEQESNFYDNHQPSPSCNSGFGTDATISNGDAFPLVPGAIFDPSNGLSSLNVRSQVGEAEQPRTVVLHGQHNERWRADGHELPAAESQTLNDLVGILWRQQRQRNQENEEEEEHMVTEEDDQN